MAEPLTHRPFMALNAKRNNVRHLKPTVIVRRPNAIPDRSHVDGSAALKEESEPAPASAEGELDEVATKKKGPRKWTDAQRAKLKATIAAKKKRGEPIGAQAWQGKKKGRRKKKASRVPRVPKLQRGTATSELATSGSSLTILLDRLIAAAEEIKQRLG